MSLSIGSIHRRGCRWATAIFLSRISLTRAYGQTVPPKNVTDGTVSLSVAPGAPAGSYALSDFEQINLYNGHLNIALPLLKIGGRGSVQSSVVVGISRPTWSTDVQTVSCGDGNPSCWSTVTSVRTPSEWWNPYQAGYGPGMLLWKMAGTGYQSCGGTPAFTNTFSYLAFQSADGTEHALYDTVLRLSADLRGEPLAFDSKNQMMGGTWQYDGRGNVVKNLYSTPETFFFDAENRVVGFCTSAADATNGCGASIASGRTIYTYDADGRRVKRQGPGGTVHFVYDAFGQMEAEYGGPVEAPGTQYLTVDHLGTTRVVSDAAQGLKCQDYLPFGREIDVAGGSLRHASPCYGTDLGVRQKFTGEQRAEIITNIVVSK